MTIWLWGILIIQASSQMLRGLPLDSDNSISLKSPDLEAVNRLLGCRGGRKLPWCKGTP